MKIKNRLLNLDMIIYQDSDWFKFSLDSVLLANFVTINYRVKKIMDFATGNAPIPMLLSYRTSAQIYGVEYQKCVYELAIQSINENNLENQIHLSCGDVSDLKNKFQSDSFDVVTCNPPYFKTLSSNYFNQNFVKSIARHEIFLNLDIIFRQAFYLLKTGGVFAMVHRTERFIEIIEKMKEYHLEPKRVQFIYPKEGKNSDLFLIEAVKNGKNGLKMVYPLIIHKDDNTYTDEVSKILEFKY
ncbi:MAG: tRNA1(Val) (adenine(37)-N6)-methyltransferase [Bacilli bacterium]|nr:tRNA1(Val) (adenine(37)-N6)-methyltransferase [Bacilli bacterium]